MRKFSKKLEIVSKMLLLLSTPVTCTETGQSNEAYGLAPTNNEPNVPPLSECPDSPPPYQSIPYPKPPSFPAGPPPPYSKTDSDFLLQSSGGQEKDSSHLYFSEGLFDLSETAFSNEDADMSLSGPANTNHRQKKDKKRKRNKRTSTAKHQSHGSKDRHFWLGRISLDETSKNNKSILRCIARNLPIENRMSNFYKIYDHKLKMMLDFIRKSYDLKDYRRIEDLIKIKRRDHRSPDDLFYYFKGFSCILNAKIESKIEIAYQNTGLLYRFWKYLKKKISGDQDNAATFSRDILNLLKGYKLLNAVETLPIAEAINYFLLNFDYLIRTNAFPGQEKALNRIKISILAICLLSEKLNGVTHGTSLDNYKRDIYSHYFKTYFDRLKRDTVECIEVISDDFLGTLSRSNVYNAICSFRCIVSMMNFYISIQHNIFVKKTENAEDFLKSHLIFLISNLVMFSLDPAIEGDDLHTMLEKSDLMKGCKKKSTEMVEFDRCLPHSRPLYEILKGLIPAANKDSERKQDSLQFDKMIEITFKKTKGMFRTKQQEPTSAAVADSKVYYNDFYYLVEVVLFLTDTNISSLKDSNEAALSDPNSILNLAFRTPYFKRSMMLAVSIPRMVYKTSCKFMAKKDQKCHFGEFIKEFLSEDWIISISTLSKQKRKLKSRLKAANSNYKMLKMILWSFSGALVIINILIIHQLFK